MYLVFCLFCSDDAEVDLFDAIHLSGRLQQARVFQDEIVDLLVQVNATELAIRVKHAEVQLANFHDPYLTVEFPRV